jgi:hypothetical protein
MIFWLALLVIIYLFWLLLIRGALWKILLSLGGWFGVYIFLSIYFPKSTATALTFSNTHYSWAIVVATGIFLLSLAHTRSD